MSTTTEPSVSTETTPTFTAVTGDSDLRAAAEWLVQTVGYPYNLQFATPAPEALWQHVIDVVHTDADGSLHGNELTRDEVADWLLDP